MKFLKWLPLVLCLILSFNIFYVVNFFLFIVSALMAIILGLKFKKEDRFFGITSLVLGILCFVVPLIFVIILLISGPFQF